MFSRLPGIFVLLCSITWLGCGESGDSADVASVSEGSRDSAPTEMDDADNAIGGPNGETVEPRPRTAYELPNETISDLFHQPYTYPYQTCMPVPEGANVSEEYIGTNEDGDDEVCIWQNAQGCAPEGELFTEWGMCEVAMTTSASFYKNPGPKYESELAVLDDPEYQTESDWVKAQIQSCGCVCCHDAQENGMQTNFATAFDISAPGVWADTFSDFGLLTAAGIIDTELLGGTFDPATNFGFNRTEVIFPTTDAERMSNFFRGEIARRGLSEERIQELVDAVPLRFAGLYTNYAGETEECEPGIGVDAEGYIHWGMVPARYVYVLEEDAKNVADPPGLDRPDGTIWRLDIEQGGTPFESGTLVYGQVPENAKQDIPSEGEAPALESGKRYKFFVLRDFGPMRLQNCHFTFEGL